MEFPFLYFPQSQSLRVRAGNTTGTIITGDGILQEQDLTLLKKELISFLENWLMAHRTPASQSPPSSTTTAPIQPTQPVS